MTRFCCIQNRNFIFLLTRPLRDVTKLVLFDRPEYPISTHTPLTGRDQMTAILRRKYTISTHTPLTGRDETGTDTAWKPLYFYSHAPYGTWPLTRSLFCFLLDFYSHAPYGTWQLYHHADDWLFLISTHTPLTGRDCSLKTTCSPFCNFYSHAPYGTWRFWLLVPHRIPGFLLTRPLRDVTKSSIWKCNWKKFLLTRPLRDVTWTNACTAAWTSFLLTRPLRDVTDVWQRKKRN